MLDVFEGSKRAEAKIIQYDLHRGFNQQWRFLHIRNGWYSIITRNTEMTLDVYQSSTNDRTKLIQYPYHGLGNQLFRFEYTIPSRREFRIIGKLNLNSLTVKNVDSPSLSLKPVSGDSNQGFYIDFKGDRTYAIRSSLSNR